MKLLKKIFSAQPKPAATLEWINALNGVDDISAIEYTGQLLSADFQRTLFKSEQYQQALFSIDEKTYIIVKRITAHYINIDNINVELAKRIESAVFLYHRQLFLYYLALIENLALSNQHALPVMLLRAINSATQMIKWRYYSHQSAPANVWLQISQLYKIAEQQSLLNISIKLYDNLEPSTISAAYIQTCMLGTLENLSLKCQQIELVSKTLKTWAAKTLIENVYDEKKHLFYVDTASNVHAKRIRNFTPDDTYRYWCVDNVNSKIELCISLIEFKITPKQQTMNEFISNKHALSTFKILRTEWSRDDYKRQRRGESRNKAVKSATISYGLEDTCKQIKQYEKIQLQRGEKLYRGEKSFEERLSAHHSVKSSNEPNVIYMDLANGDSHIVDESNKGVGLYTSKPANKVSLWMMVGLTVKELKLSTRIGIICSIRPMAHNKLHIGIKVLNKTPSCVELSNLSLKTAKVTEPADNFNVAHANFSNAIATFTCLHLPKERGISSQETLVLPKLHYNKTDIFKFNLLGTDMIIKFTDILEQHDDWIRVTYAQTATK